MGNIITDATLHEKEKRYKVRTRVQKKILLNRKPQQHELNQQADYDVS